MNHSPVLDTVQELLSQGDTGKALQVLIQLLEQAGNQSEYLRTLRVVEANFNAARQQEQKGILDFGEARRIYAKSNDAILSVLEDLKAGRNKREPEENSKFTRKLTLILGIITLIFLALAAWNNYRKNTPGRLGDSACPEFRSKGFKVMVLEFQKLSGEDSKPELGIKTRIQDLTTKNNMDTDVRILPAKAFDNATPDQQQALELANQCQADMVIWGDYEKLADSINVDIRYSLADSNWPPGAAIQTFKNISELKSDRMKISNLDEAVFRLCTVMALHENKLDLAQKWLNKIQHPTQRELEMKQGF
jgi:hypothetical protein